MDHDGMMSRQLLGTLAILACGLIPDRFAGGSPGPAALQPLQRAVQSVGCLADRTGLLSATG